MFCMMAFTITIANTPIRIQCRDASLKERYASYLTDEAPAFTVSVSDEELDAAWQAHSFRYMIDCRTGERLSDDVMNDPRFAAELDAIRKHCRLSDEEDMIYRRIAYLLPRYDAFLLHGCAVGLDGRGYVFSGRSGVGKSTHVSLWLERFPEAKIINGDKPIIMKQNGQWLVCGSPWQGKENLGCPMSLPLQGICHLTRGETNTIAPTKKVSDWLFNSVLLPEEKEDSKRLFSLLNEMTASVPLYRMTVNNFASDAVTVSHQGLTQA